MSRQSLIFISVFYSWCSMCSPLFANVVVYPTPPGADMASGVTVTANGLPVPMYAFPYQTPGQGGRFCQFDFSDSVKIVISPVEPGTVVRPARTNLNPVYSDNKLTLTLTSPMNIHIVGVAYIFANAIEQNPPQQGDPGVVYYGPGVSTTPIKLLSNQTLYLAGGAYLKLDNTEFNNLNNITIKGRGILVGLMKMNNCSDVSWSGIVQLNPFITGWSGRVTECNRVSFINFKEVGAMNYSTDGTNLLNCSNILYDNCTWCCDDDNIAIKGYGGEFCTGNPATSLPNENITIRNCMFYNSNNNCIVLGAETRASRYHNIRIQNCDFYHDERYGGDGKAAISVQCLDGTYFSKLVFEDCTVNTNHNLINFFFTTEIFGICGNQSWPGGIDDVVFRNFKVTGSGSKAIILEGWDANKKITNVKFSNIVIDGNCINSTGDSHFKLNEFTGNISVTGCMPDSN